MLHASMLPHSNLALMETTTSATQELLCESLKFSETLLDNGEKGSFKSQQFLKKKKNKKKRKKNVVVSKKQQHLSVPRGFAVGLCVFNLCACAGQRKESVICSRAV